MEKAIYLKRKEKEYKTWAKNDVKQYLKEVERQTDPRFPEYHTFDNYVDFIMGSYQPERIKSIAKSYEVELTDDDVNSLMVIMKKALHASKKFQVRIVLIVLILKKIFGVVALLFMSKMLNTSWETL